MLWSGGQQRDSGWGGHGDVSGVTTLSKEGGRGQPGKQCLDATAQVLAFPLRPRNVSTAGRDPDSHKKTPSGAATQRAKNKETRRCDGTH